MNQTLFLCSYLLGVEQSDRAKTSILVIRISLANVGVSVSSLERCLFLWPPLKPGYGVANGIKRCDCADTRDVTETGFLDGMVPTINTGQSGGTWASQLYTISAVMTTIRIGFRFQNSVALREVELYIFFCPALDIGAATITISTSVSYPSFIQLESIGSVTLTSAMVDCVSLSRINIPSLSSHLQWHLKESTLVR